MIDNLLERAPKNMKIPIDEFKIVGIEKIRRDLIMVRLSSAQDKKRKEQILEIFEKHRNYFNKPVSDLVTKRTVGRKHRANVIFDWIPKDKLGLPEESLLAEGYSKADHDKGDKKTFGRKNFWRKFVFLNKIFIFKRNFDVWTIFFVHQIVNQNSIFEKKMYFSPIFRF